MTDEQRQNGFLACKQALFDIVPAEFRSYVPIYLTDDKIWSVTDAVIQAVLTLEDSDESQQ